MSQWVRKSSAFLIRKQGALAPLDSSREEQLSETSTPGNPLQSEPETRMPLPWWMKLGPFFLSAVFFLSAFFAVFSPLPLVLSFFQRGRGWTLLAIMTNSVLVYILGGVLSFVVYLAVIGVTAIAMSETLNRRGSLEKAGLVAFFGIVFAGAAIWAGYCVFHHLDPWVELTRYASQVVDAVIRALSTNSGVDLGDPEEWKRSLLIEIPSAFAICLLVFVWANLVLLMRINPRNLRQKLGLDGQFLQKWKVPEILVWPTIAAGFFLLFDAGRVTDVALNFFKFFMAIYTLQGLSILSHFFDLWGIRGVFRGIGFMIAVFLMTPLLLSLGFFDLWFDFRSKLRQS